MRKTNTTALCGEASVLLSVLCLSSWLSLTFLLRKHHLSHFSQECLTHRVFDKNKSPRPSALLTETSGNVPPENSLCWPYHRLVRKSMGRWLSVVMGPDCGTACRRTSGSQRLLRFFKRGSWPTFLTRLLIDFLILFNSFYAVLIRALVSFTLFYCFNLSF